MRTWTGTEAPLAEGVGEVNILDLAMHMGREARWGGFGDTEYTVLHHTTLVTLLWLRGGFPREGLAYVFAHDLHESYTGDIPSPVKKVMGDGVKKLEKHLDGRVYEALGLPLPDAATLRFVKLCDLAAMVIEAPLFGPPLASGGSGVARGGDAPADFTGTVWDHPDIPSEFRPDVIALVRKAMPDLPTVIANRLSTC
jgi:hypothetical protein